MKKGNILEKNAQNLYVAFRLIVGILFLMHGIQKLPGIMSGSLGTLFVLAGLIELVAGTFLIVGLYVRPVALISAVEMLVAFFYIHVMNNGTLNPLVNKGEPALLFFAAFLVLIGFGAGKWSLDKKIGR